jgi:hypothetical protein
VPMQPASSVELLPDENTTGLYELQMPVSQLQASGEQIAASGQEDVIPMDVRVIENPPVQSADEESDTIEGELWLLLGEIPSMSERVTKKLLSVPSGTNSKRPSRKNTLLSLKMAHGASNVKS